MAGTDVTGLTPKGRATRERIVTVAADLMFERGVAGTSIDDVRRVAGVSGSQMTHYFADKRSLVRAVVAWQANFVLALHQLPVLGELDSFAALDLWVELNVARQRRAACVGGCRLGSLAGELAETDGAVRGDLAQGFRQWETLFRHGLGLMRQRGDLRPDTNTDELAMTLLAALEGGLLLTQTTRDVRPVEVALRSVVAYVRSFATDEAQRRDTGRKPAVRRKAARVVATL